jgi:hypothetical protein
MLEVGATGIEEKEEEDCNYNLIFFLQVIFVFCEFNPEGQITAFRLIVFLGP